MRKKVKTTPLQCAILWALAETGECSLPVLLNILLSKFPHLSPISLQNEVESSIGILRRAGCLYLTRVVGGERTNIPVLDREALNLGDLLSWDDARREFSVSEEHVADVIVQLTNGGVEWLDLITAASNEPTPVVRPRK